MSKTPAEIAAGMEIFKVMKEAIDGNQPFPEVKSDRLSIECAHCGVEHRSYQTAPLCEQCHYQEKQERRTKKWLEIQPPLYADTDPDIIPNAAAFRSVVSWPWQPRGLLLHGPTRTGKSRTAWVLLRRLYIEDRKSVAILNSRAGVEYAAKFHESAKDVEDWFNQLLAVDVLFLDDPFKVKMTDSFESALFSLIDGRGEGCKPIIVTLNDTGESLKLRMSTDRGGPMIERLREFCEAITF